jgi:cyclopropane-fatty-acyl-phospholipid synthase
MFEHVGKQKYREYYDICYNLLKDHGIMLIHTITTNERTWDHNSFISKYIFPGGELPHLSDFTKSFSDRWLLEDIQNFGLSYEKTLMHWYNNLDSWKGLEHYDDKFKRIWTYYLLGCSANFKAKNVYLLQLVYTKLSNKDMDNCYYIRD